MYLRCFTNLVRGDADYLIILKLCKLANYLDALQSH